MASPRPLRVVIAGLGFGAAAHLPGWRAQPGIEIVGVAARRLAKAESVAGEHGVPFATDSLEALMSLMPDAASLALPPAVGAKAARLALDRRISVVSEKPIAATLAEARSLASSAQGLSAAVNLGFWELETFRELKRRIAMGDLGDLKNVQIIWRTESYAHRHRIWGWKTDRDRFGGILSSHASHIVHLAEWLFGPAVAVEAQLGNAATRPFTPPGATAAWDDAAFVTHHEGGASCSVSLANGDPGADIHEWVVECGAGTFLLRKRGAGIMTGFELSRAEAGGASEIVARDDHRDASGGRLLPLQCLLDRFVVAVRERRGCMPDFDVGVRVQYLLDRIEAAAATSARVKCERQV